MYSPSEEIKSKLDIVDVIREYIQLKPVGVNFVALCPFHREKTPSFIVSPDKQIWHCFGCGRGGDIFSFVMEIEGVGFPEALRILAHRAGVELKKYDFKLSSKRNRILDILETACNYYHHILLEDKRAKLALDYLQKRKLNLNTIEEWRLGYSPDSWDDLIIFLKNKGFKEEEIFLAGLSIKKENSNTFYNRFRGRIMFPINDINGNVVAFSARVSPEKEAKEKMGKYINSPQTLVYDKSKILFGLDKAKLAIKREDLAIVVEGQMDVISAHQHGFKNVIASSGTALTVEQIKLIKRYTSNIALAFDSDQAGELAIERGTREAMKLDCNIKVIEIPVGKDPDECIRNNPEDWINSVKKAKHIMEYYFSKTVDNVNLDDIENKRKVVAKLLPIIARFSDKIEQNFWVKKLSERIEVEEYLLYDALSKISSQQRTRTIKEEVTEPQKITLSRKDKLAELILAILLKFPELFEYAINNVSTEYMQGGYNSLYKKMVIYYNNIIEKQNLNTQKDFYFNFKEWLTASQEEAVIRELDRISLLAEKDFYNYKLEEAKQEIINASQELKKIFLMERKKEIEKLIFQLEKEGEEDKVEALLAELKLLNEEINYLT